MLKHLLILGGLFVLAGCACPMQPGGQQATRIEADQKTGIVRIISDNREVAYFNRDGELVAPDFRSTGGPVEEPPAGR